MNDTGASRPFLPDTLSKEYKVLFELRACSHGFAGIPQEARLIFSAFSEDETFEVGGLLNPFRDLVLPRGLRKPSRDSDESHPSKGFYNQARLVTAMDAEMEGHRRKDIFSRWTRRLEERDLLPQALRYLRPPRYYPLLPVDGLTFDDFVWTKFFHKTLSSSDRAHILSNKFFTIRKGWIEAHSWCRNPRSSVKIDTRGWQFFLCQLPTPFSVHPETRIVVRYHDAIPVLLPHTTNVGAVDMKQHFRGLRASVRNGAFFACTSEPVRADLLRMFPEVEPNTTVIPDIVSNQYYRVEASPEGLARIIHLRKCPETAPQRQTPAPKAIKTSYVLLVSTLEPRKNFKILLEAWEVACQSLETRPLLVLVANLGWRYGEEIEEIRKLVKAKRVAHLSRVPLHELRVLYSGAQAVVCPSRSEGFDLSGIEAMLCETPVIASDIAVHRSVYGDAAIYFDPFDVKGCGNVLLDALSTPKDSGPLASLRDKGLERTKLYTRDAIGRQWADLFHRLAGRSTGRVPIENSVSDKLSPTLSNAELA